MSNRLFDYQETSSTPLSHPELSSEQAYVDHAYDRLEQMRRLANDRMESVLDTNISSTPSDRTDRDVIVATALSRLEQLQIGDQALCFGRIDNDTDDRFYIGRVSVSDENQDPLVVDWRAPVCEPFYRATPRERMGLRLRRHFQTRGRKIVDIEDEEFVLGDHDEDAPRAPQTLFAALEQKRTGIMRDIVATIQKEQDDIIRAPLAGVIVVQGGPGTGKTAVALHRAAYLLYTHRFPLERQGVLVIGPNPIFMKYIAQVLPSLGETGVTMRTVGELYSHAEVRGSESSDAESVKGDLRMVRVLKRAVRDRERALRRDLVVPYGSRFLRVTASRTRSLVESTRRRRGTHNSRRRYLALLLAAELRSQIREVSDDALFELEPTVLVAKHPEEIAEFWEDVREEPSITDALDRMWPLLRPTELLHDFFGAPALISSAAKGILSAGEQKSLERDRSHSFDEIEWTVADIALLDEARVLLGTRKRGAEDPDDFAYGHIVIDEAQDLSPMQLRMISRRSISGSMTVVGDIGQASGAWVPQNWNEVINQLDSEHRGSVVELTVNYRTPGEVMDIAAQVLSASNSKLIPPTSVRRTGTQPQFISVDRSQILSNLREIVQQEKIVTDGGSVGVVVPHTFIEHAEAEVANELEMIGVYSLTGAKGLEFDSVVVVEPEEIVQEEAHGLAALYVALTRTTNRLTVVHSSVLPDYLRVPETSAVTE